MRRTGMILLLIFLSCCLCLIPAAAEQESEAASSGAAEEGDWTVMIYMCGSDLESRYSYATENLEEISRCEVPYAYSAEIAAMYGYNVTEEMLPSPGKVNVVIETGGCKAWHAQRLGLDVSTRKLQRWSFELIRNDGSGGFRLEEELPLASMARPETLRDFIRWSAEKYPAKRYALVLWDHGGGSKTGIFIDELFNNDTMLLYELGEAVRDGGVYFDTIVFDACLMANIETAYIMKDFGRYMVASEEVVAGQGTAIGDWLQELYYAPTSDGKRLGRLICDTTQIKMASLEDSQASEMLTWSVIDLSKMERLGECLDRFYRIVCKAYTDYPVLTQIYAYQIINSERYGDRDDSMFDLASLLYNAGLYQTADQTIRQDVLEAVEDAVIYNARGCDHFSARGISFCYAAILSPEELDVYAKNCPSPHYLALTDAVSPWTAPDWVYKYVDRLPEIDELDAYRIEIEKKICEDGTPGVALAENTSNVSLILYRWYGEDAENDQLIDMGTLLASEGRTKDGETMYMAGQPWLWPSIEGTPCCFRLRSFYPGGTSLCEVPIKVGADIWKLRIGYTADGRAEVYGVWDGGEYVGMRFSRNMKSLAQMVGRNYQLIYPVADTEEAFFQIGKERPFLRNLLVERTMLPPGAYYIEYIIMDIFQRTMPLERIRVYWDGEKLTMAEGTEWEGTVRLTWDGRSAL